MEVFDQDRLARLAEAAREDNGATAQRPEHDSPPTSARAHTVGGADRWLGRPALWLAIRCLGALAVLAVGAVHLQQYFRLYSAIPTIGTLFVLNFAGAIAIGLGLLAPVERFLGRRWGGAALGLLALAGIGLAATAFAFLLISERTPLFGFMEPGYDPAAILASRVAEGATVVLLGAFLAARFVGRVPAGRW
jgi:hypothetical protein